MDDGPGARRAILPSEAGPTPNDVPLPASFGGNGHVSNLCENHNRSSCRRGARHGRGASELARRVTGDTGDDRPPRLRRLANGLLVSSAGLLGLVMGLSPRRGLSRPRGGLSPGLARGRGLSRPRGRALPGSCGPRRRRPGRLPERRHFAYGWRITSLRSPAAGVDRTGHRQWAGGGVTLPARRLRSQRSGRRCGCVAQGSRSSCTSSGGSPRKSSTSSNQARRRVLEDRNICSRP